MCRQFRVSGRVQGVFYRDSTRAFATPRNLQGHAINLADGDVEVRVCGANCEIEELRSWLWHGPQRADVHEVVEQEVECSHPRDFTTG
ncbi:MAG: acylphosphatase [Woeseiaceae bacterium]